MSHAAACADVETFSDFLQRAAAHLSPAPPGPGAPLSNPGGDHDLDPRGHAAAPGRPHRRAAVLVPVVASGPDVHVVLTIRASHLRDHSGQVAFPGGKIDPADASPAAAALREAQEEIGLDPARVAVLGYLDPYLSATGFLVTPVVGAIRGPTPLRLNRDEVAEAFEVPLPFLMDRDRHEVRSGVHRGLMRYYYAIPFGERLIWGLTAGIVHNLATRLYGSERGNAA